MYRKTISGPSWILTYIRYPEGQSDAGRKLVQSRKLKKVQQAYFEPVKNYF